MKSHNRKEMLARMKTRMWKSLWFNWLWMLHNCARLLVELVSRLHCESSLIKVNCLRLQVFCLFFGWYLQWSVHFALWPGNSCIPTHLKSIWCALDFSILFSCVHWQYWLCRDLPVNFMIYVGGIHSDPATRLCIVGCFPCGPSS